MDTQFSRNNNTRNEVGGKPEMPQYFEQTANGSIYGNSTQGQAQYSQLQE